MEKKDNNDDNNRNNNPLEDIYDLYNMASSIYSNNTTMKRDYTLGTYNENIYEYPMAKFVIEQRKAVKLIKTAMVSNSSLIKKHIINRENKCVFNRSTGNWEVPKIKVNEVNEKVKFIENKIINNYNNVEELLLSEIDEMVIISKTSRGQIMNSILNMGLNREQRVNSEREEEFMKREVGENNGK